MTYLLGLSMLLTAWVFADPAGAGPDEPSHYVRALGAAAGNLFGDPGGYTSYADFTPTQLKSFNAYVRKYPVPKGLAPVTLACNIFKPTTPATCESAPFTPQGGDEEFSQHAGQPPLPYLLAGPVMETQSTPNAADLAGRSMLALWCLVLIGVPLALAGGYRRRIVLGLTVALTPMAIFTGSILNPNGIEIFSSVGFFVALLAVAEGRFPRASLAAIAFTGVFLTMSRPFAPLWIVVGLMAAVGVAGPSVFWKAVCRRPKASVAVTALVGLSALSTLLFVRHYTAPMKMPVSGGGGFGELRKIADLAVGNFGWLDTALPNHVDDSWLWVILVITVAALMFGNLRERVTIVITTIVIMAVTYEISYKFLLPLGIGPQGRHFLPIMTLQPMLCIIVLTRQGKRVQIIAVGVPVLLATVLQFIGWMSNSTREGLGVPAPALHRFPALLGDLLGTPAWSPPSGFLPWLMILLIGLVLLIFASAQALVSPIDSASGVAFSPDATSSLSEDSVGDGTHGQPPSFAYDLLL